MSEASPAFSLHFAALAWSQIGALDAVRFEQLQTTLEHYAGRAAEWMTAPGHPVTDECVPITSEGVIAECFIDDHRRRMTVARLEPWLTE